MTHTRLGILIAQAARSFCCAAATASIYADDSGLHARYLTTALSTRCHETYVLREEWVPCGVNEGEQTTVWVEKKREEMKGGGCEKEREKGRY